MNKNSNLFLIPFVVVIIAVVIVAGCTQQVKATNTYIEKSITPQVIQEEDTNCPIIEYGNGVLIFKCTETTFAKTLSGYISKNNVTVTAIGGMPDRNYYNRNIGYLVVVK